MSDIEQDLTEIRRLHREWWASNNGLDVERMRECFAPAYLMWNLNGHPYFSLAEKVRLFEYYRGHLVPTGPPELWNVQATVDGDMGYVTSEGILPVAVTSDEGSGASLIDAMAPFYERRDDQILFRFRETSIFRRDDGRGSPVWKIWHFHCSPLAPENEARPGFGDTAAERGKQAPQTMTYEDERRRHSMAGTEGLVTVDTLVEGTVITMDPERRVIRDGAVAVADGRIVAVGKSADLRARYSAGRVLGGPRRFVIPGLIDCHNHLAQALVRDYALEDFPNIYRIYVPCEMALDADDAAISARFGIAQLLRSGVTTVAETTFSEPHEEAIARTVIETGIRAAMARGQGDRTSRLAANYEQVHEKSSYKDDLGQLREDLARTEDFIQRWLSEGDGRLRPWINNLGVPSCSEQRFLETKALGEKYGTGMMVHINRDREEVELSVALFGERPIERLYRIGALSSAFVAIHAMLTTEREIEMLAETGAGVAHAPVVCTDIVSAVTRVPAMRAAGVVVGLGCDTVINDILKVMRIAFIMHTQETGIRLFDPCSFTTEDAFAMGTIDAARLLSWDHEIGSLEVGKAADIAIVDGENVRLTPSYNPVGTLVRYATGTDVESVLVAGRLIVDGGKLLTIDERDLLDEAEVVGAKLGVVLEPRRYRPMPAYH